MNARLDDNAREALQFLLLGAGLILAARGLHHLLDRAWEPGEGATNWEMATEAFRNGYLVPKGTLVAGSTAMAGRLGIGALFTLLAGGATALFGALIGQFCLRGWRSGALAGVRCGLVIAAAWCLYASLALPPTTVEASARGLQWSNRPAFLRTIPWPWPAETHSLSWEELGHCDQRRVDTGWLGGGVRHEVACTAGKSVRPIAFLATGGRQGTDAVMACEQLVQALHGNGPY